MQLWIWRHLRIELPDGWEMLQFAREQGTGRCAFADRYQFRLELNWRAVESRPDLGRMMSDYLARLRADETMPDAQATEAGGWPGIVGAQHGQLTSRFGTHLADEGCVVEVVFLWPGARDAGLEASVLASVAAEPVRDGLRRWRAFGMGLRVADGLSLSECVVQPAVARMVFRSEDGVREATYQRLGMVGEWLRGSVGEWLARQSPRDVVRSSAGWETRGSHELALVSGTRRAGLLRRARRYEAAAWVCPADGRLYAGSATGLQGPAACLPGGRLTCCGELEAAR